MSALYKTVTKLSEPVLNALLRARIKRGKEDPLRFTEKKGIASLPRPEGKLLWLHAASVGESVSALIVIERMLQLDPGANILVTTGTLTSAQMMEKRLPKSAVHQFYPLDHPRWVKRFLEHWRPDMVLWMESELWPNMLSEIEAAHIPAILVNARLSPRSFKRWKRAKKTAQKILRPFEFILTQTQQDKTYFEALGAHKVICTDNLKYSAKPLTHAPDDLKKLREVLEGRPLWLYASTHKGEEELAVRVHRILKSRFPNLLTLVIPRHPERAEQIIKSLQDVKISICRRTQNKTLPQDEDELYLIDTLGEMGLFYQLSPLSCIGRSFSADGGGGHNPIEAAQLHSAVLHGPNVQNLDEIFREMDEARAALNISKPQELAKVVRRLLTNQDELLCLQDKAFDFAKSKSHVIERVMTHIMPLWKEIDVKNTDKEVSAHAL